MPNNEHALCYLKMCEVVLNFFEKRSELVKQRCFPLKLYTEYLNFQIGHEVVHLLNPSSEHGEPGMEWMHGEPIWKGRL